MNDRLRCTLRLRHLHHLENPNFSHHLLSYIRGLTNVFLSL